MPLLWLSIAFLTGIWLGSITSLPKTILLAVFLLCSFLAILEKRLTPRIDLLQKWRKISPLPMAVLLAALALGALRYPPPVPSGLPGSIASFNDRGETTLTAFVTTLPEETDRSTRFVADSITITDPGGSEQPLSGKIQVEVWAGTNVNYGDLVRISGNPETPPENESFSYQEYLVRKGIHSLVSFPRLEVLSSGYGNPLLATLYRFRLKGYEVLNSILPQPQAALLSGILLGLDQDLPDDLVLAFQETGTAHIIAISGFNIAIISAFFFWLFRLLATRWKAFFFSVLTIFLYALLVGAEPAVMRAAIMGSITILGTQIGRRGSGLNTLVFTAAVMCFLDPYLLWDVSFQLSFAATLGLIVIGNPLLRWFTNWLEMRMPSEKARKVADPVGEYLLLTLAAQAATLPLMAWHFHQISLTSVIANPLILPAQPLIMMLGAVALLVGMVFLPLGQILGWFVLPLLSYTTGVVEWLARLPGSIQITGSSLVWIFILLAAAALILLVGKRFPDQLKPAILLTASGMAAVVIWMAVAMRPDGNLHITLLALDEGHAVLIRTPLGQTYLLNGAASGRNLAAVLDRRLSPFDRDLEGLILTEPQSTSISGLNFLAEQMGVEQVLWGVNVPANATTRRLENLLHQAGTSSRIFEDGQVFQLEPGLLLVVLKSGEEGTALLLRNGDFSLLIPGGVKPESLLPVVKPASATLLLLDKSDLAAVQPEDWKKLDALGIISNENRLTPPDETWISTGEKGQVQVITDGSRMVLEGRK